MKDVTDYLPDKVAVEDKLIACESIQRILDLLCEDGSPDLDTMGSIQVMVDYLKMELDSLRCCLLLGGGEPEVPSEPRLCACAAMRKLQEAGLS